MCRVSARRLSIYNFAWEALNATNLQAESKILKYWNIKSTNQNEKFYVSLAHYNIIVCR
jgi:hypothetical protein